MRSKEIRSQSINPIKNNCFHIVNLIKQREPKCTKQLSCMSFPWLVHWIEQSNWQYVSIKEPRENATMGLQYFYFYLFRYEWLLFGIDICFIMHFCCENPHKIEPVWSILKRWISQLVYRKICTSENIIAKVSITPRAMRPNSKYTFPTPKQCKWLLTWSSHFTPLQCDVVEVDMNWCEYHSTLCSEGVLDCLNGVSIQQPKNNNWGLSVYTRLY